MYFYLHSSIAHYASDNMTPKYTITCYMECRTEQEMTRVLQICEECDIDIEATSSRLCHKVYICDLCTLYTLFEVHKIKIHKAIHMSVIHHLQYMHLFAMRGRSLEFKHARYEMWSQMSAAQKVALMTILNQKRYILSDARILNPELTSLAVMAFDQYKHHESRGVVVCTSSVRSEYERIIHVCHLKVDIIDYTNLPSELDMDTYTTCIWDAPLTPIIHGGYRELVDSRYVVFVSEHPFPSMRYILPMLTILIPGIANIPSSRYSIKQATYLDEVTVLIHSVVISRSLSDVRWFSSAHVPSLVYYVPEHTSLDQTIRAFLRNTGLHLKDVRVRYGHGTALDQQTIACTSNPALSVYVHYSRHVPKYLSADHRYVTVRLSLTTSKQTV